MKTVLMLTVIVAPGLAWFGLIELICEGGLRVRAAELLLEN